MRNKSVLLLACIFLIAGLTFGRGTVTVEAEQPAQGECVVEVSSRRILHAKNASLPLANASTTKIMTALVILEDCPLDDKVTIPAEAAGVEGSSVYLRAGEEYTVEELLYGLMLRSGNDAAVALALHHSGSIAAFAQVMNERAILLGATDSCFVNPHGLPDERHHTTARDLALISAAAMENETFRTIVSTRCYAPRDWYNKNKLLSSYEGACGVKTGYTMQAGRCLVSAAERAGMTLVCAVLDCPPMYERSAELLDRAFADYMLVRLTDKQEGVNGFAIDHDFSYPLTEQERTEIRIMQELVEPLPKTAGSIAGQIRIFLANDLLFSQNLYIMEEN